LICSKRKKGAARFCSCAGRHHGTHGRRRQVALLVVVHRRRLTAFAAGEDRHLDVVPAFIGVDFAGVDVQLPVALGLLELLWQIGSLADLRKKKAWAENSLERKKTTKKSLEKAIGNDLELLKGAGALAPKIQDRIDGRRKQLDSIASREPMFRKLITGRAKEEKAFLQLYRVIEKMRKELKAP
jgi:hypothetical protein